MAYNENGFGGFGGFGGPPGVHGFDLQLGFGFGAGAAAAAAAAAGDPVPDMGFGAGAAAAAAAPAPAAAAPPMTGAQRAVDEYHRIIDFRKALEDRQRADRFREQKKKKRKDDFELAEERSKNQVILAQGSLMNPTTKVSMDMLNISMRRPIRDIQNCFDAGAVDNFGEQLDRGEAQGWFTFRDRSDMLVRYFTQGITGDMFNRRYTMEDRITMLAELFNYGATDEVYQWALSQAIAACCKALRAGVLVDSPGGPASPAWWLSAQKEAKHVLWPFINLIAPRVSDVDLILSATMEQKQNDFPFRKSADGERLLFFTQAYDNLCHQVRARAWRDERLRLYELSRLTTGPRPATALDAIAATASAGESLPDSAASELASTMPPVRDSLPMNVLQHIASFNMPIPGRRDPAHQGQSQLTIDQNRQTVTNQRNAAVARLVQHGDHDPEYVAQARKEARLSAAMSLIKLR